MRGRAELKRPGRPLADKDVLIVEDRYLMAQDLADEVVRLGGRVVGPANSVQGAAGLLAQSKPDLAMLDISLQGETVFPLAEELERREIPILFVTGYDQAVMPPRWKSHGCVAKPLDRQRLRVEIERLQLAG